MELNVIFKNDDEKFKIFLDAMCNGGLYCLSQYGIEVECKNFKSVRQKLKSENPDHVICYEDILLECLKCGYTLNFIDLEGGSDVELTREMMLANIESVPSQYLQQIISECDDMETADAVLQYILYKELVFS